MTAYFFVFTGLTLGAFWPARMKGVLDGVVTLAVFVCLVLFIGLRDGVGPDWLQYVGHVELVRHLTLLQSGALFGDPFYAGMVWYISSQGWDVTALNVFAALVFCAGLVSFSRTLPAPAFSLALAFPYLILVVGMGLTRQSIALGFSMLAMALAGKERLKLALLMVVLGGLFHKSALLLLPLYLALRGGQWAALWKGVLLALAVLPFFGMFATAFQGLVSQYIENESYHSEGGVIRVALNLPAAMMFFLVYKRIDGPGIAKTLMLRYSLLSFALFAVVFRYSTAADRMALYLLPLQLYVWTNFVSLYERDPLRNYLRAAVLSVYWAVFLVWLFYSSNSYRWLPYKTILW